MYFCFIFLFLLTHPTEQRKWRPSLFTGWPLGKWKTRNNGSVCVLLLCVCVCAYLCWCIYDYFLIKSVLWKKFARGHGICVFKVSAPRKKKTLKRKEETCVRGYTFFHTENSRERKARRNGDGEE